MARPEWDQRPEDDAPETVELNLTSLVDVVMVLLVIFMVSTSAVIDHDRLASATGQVELQLPSGQMPASDTPRGEVVVQIDADGSLYQNGVATEWRSMAKELADRMAKDPELQVRVDADQRLPVQKAVEVLENLQNLGIRNVGLGTKGQQ